MTDEASSLNSLGTRNLGAIIGGTYRIYKEGFLRLVVIVAIVQVAIAVGFLVFEKLFVSPLEDTFQELANLGPDELAASGFGDIFGENLGAFVLFAVTLGVAGSMAFVLLYGAVAHAVAEHVARSSMNVTEAYRFAARRLLPMIGAVVVDALVFVGIVVVIGGAAILVGFVIPFLGGFLGGLLWLSLIPIVIYVGVRLSFMLLVVLIEDRGPIEALKGSWELVQGNWWRVLGISIVVGIIAIVIGLLLDATIGRVWAIGPTVASILSAPITIIAATLLYFDLRVRAKGYGLDMLARELEVGRSGGAT